MSVGKVEPVASQSQAHGEPRHAHARERESGGGGQVLRRREASAGATWMKRLSCVFCCRSLVFSCSKEKMYSAVCWRMAA